MATVSAWSGSGTRNRWACPPTALSGARLSSYSVWVVVPLAAAALVPFRHDGSLHDRAVGNFGAASVVAGFFAWEIMIGGVDGILGGGMAALNGPFTFMTLAAAVLFAGAGAAFWLHREDRHRH